MDKVDIVSQQKKVGKSSSLNRLALIIIAVGIVFILLWIGITGFRIIKSSLSLVNRQDEIEELFDRGIMNTDPDTVNSLVQGTHDDLFTLNQSLSPITKVAPFFSWIPSIGPLLDASPYLLIMAESGSEAAYFANQALKPALSILQNDDESTDSKFPALFEVIERANSDLEKAADELDKLELARSKIKNADELPWRVRSLIYQIDSELPLVQKGLKFAAILPKMIGQGGQKTYLLVAQNEDELRPTGGFISGAGLLVVEDGEIVEISFTDANSVDDWQNKPYEFPPDPFFEIMGMDIFLFRDANYWPDFPTSAETLMKLFSYGQDVNLDGVIAIDQHFLEMLLEVVGPIYIPELEKTVSSQNITAEMRTEWEPDDSQNTEWWRDRKSFMGPLAKALKDHFEQNLTSIDPIYFSRMIDAAANQKHLQIYARDPEIASILAETGLDNHQSDENGQDFLQVIDTSMGFNKVNAAVNRKIEYHVFLDEIGDYKADLNIRYDHLREPHNMECDHGAPPYTPDTKYEHLIDDCYWNYIRVYAPDGSQLIGGSGSIISSDQLLSGRNWDGKARVAKKELENLNVFDNFILLQQGGELTTDFDYLLPPTIVKSSQDGEHYKLVVRKQAGTKSETLLVKVTLPPDSIFIDSNPSPSSVDKRTITFETVLDTDIVISLHFKIHSGS
jgi:hypothetical protein